MSEPLKPCPHCQGTNMKIQDRLLWDGGGKVLTCQNSNCIARIWGHDEADVVARWNRRTPGPATKAMLATLSECPSMMLDNRMVQAFIDEWKGSSG